MDFAQRSTQPTHPAGPAPAGAGAPGHHSKRGRLKDYRVLRIMAVLLLFSASILIVALLISLVTGGPKNEAKSVNTKEYQAVFLNGGQVYFGHIQSLNDKFTRINDIYYLRVNQTVQPNQSTSTTQNNDVSLVKLGCELHGPEDQMVINRDQVIFWENLKPAGQVTKAIAAFKQQNPNGQTCPATTK